MGCATGNCDDPPNDNVVGELYNPTTGAALGIDPRTTGDGLAAGSACGVATTTRWMIFDTYPVPGYAPTACSIPQRPQLVAHFCNLASALTQVHANELKAKKITVYTIALGSLTDINEPLMKAMASDPAFYYRAPTSNELQAIFQKVAQDIKLRLVQ